MTASRSKFSRHSRSVDGKEQVHRTLGLAERLVQPLVAKIGAAPDLVLERLLNVVLSERFDYKIASLSQ
jgi:hypothetical protein